MPNLIDKLLMPRRVFVYPAVLLVVMLVAALNPIVNGHPPFTNNGEPDGGDLTAKLTGGRMALLADMRHLYDSGEQWRVQQALIGGGGSAVNRHGLVPFVAPPFAAYLFLPFAALPYLAGVVLWAAFSVSLLAASLWMLWPLLSHVDRFGYGRILILALSSFPAFRLLVTGQDAAVCLFLFAVGLRLLLARRDGAAGAALALGLFKPQFFVLAPVFFLLQRRWRALCAWVAVAGMLAAVSVALVGPSGVLAYARFLRGGEFDKGGIYLGLSWDMPSLLAIERLATVYLPSPLGSAFGLVMLGAGGALLIWWGLRALVPARTQQELELLYGGMVLVTVLASPHVQYYDAVMLLLPALLLYQALPDNRQLHVLLLATYVSMWGIAFIQPPLQSLPGPLPLLGAPWDVLPLIGLFVVGQRLLQPTGKVSARSAQEVVT